jgi:DNA polymerase (family X)
LGRADTLARRIVARLQETAPVPCRVVPVAGLRRFDYTVQAVDLLASTPRPAKLLDTFAGWEDIGILERGPRHLSALVAGERVILTAVPPDEFPCALLHRTGTPEHVAQLQAFAASRWFDLSPTSLRDTSKARQALASEEEIYAALGLAFVPPELRHGAAEVARAAAGPLPQLVTFDDIRGDLHVHSDWSDGRDPIEEMVRAARALGYQYVALTDHSQRSAASRVLTIDRLLEQVDEVARIREHVPGIEVLHGVEVDILPDGMLDFSDDLLARLDIVLASLHDGAGQGPPELLARYKTAMRHPMVNIITHPTNRLIGRRDAYALDYDELFAEAAGTGTILEIDGAPAHLDLEGEVAERAIAAGAMLSIDSDAHYVEGLERQMRYGVGIARRGWIEPRHVVNTRPWPEVREMLMRKRAGISQ